MAQGDNAANNQQDGAPSILSIVSKMLLFFYAYRWIVGSPQSTPQNGQGGPHVAHANLWELNDRFDIRVYTSDGIHREVDLSEKSYVDDYLDFEDEGTEEASTPKWKSYSFDDEPLFEKSNVLYNWDEQDLASEHLKIPCSSYLQNNGSLWAHVYFYHNGLSPDPSSDHFDNTATEHHFEMVEYRKKSRVKKFKNLIDASRDQPEDEIENDDSDLPPDPYVGYWCPMLSLRMVLDFSKFPLNGIPDLISGNYNISDDPELEPNYYPVGFADTFWVLKETFVELNDTVEELDLEISYSPISLWKFQLQAQMEASWKQQSSYGMQEEGDNEEVRRMMLETNPILLTVTMIVSILHMIFDFLAFKNDISFWKNQKDMKGLSVKTIFLNCACQLVIFLYLFDNETSWMILISCGIGVLIEFWKIRQAADVTWGSSGGWLGVLPWVKIEDKESYVKSGTSEYDRQAMQYLSYALYPIIIGYSIYSLLYEEHKGWISWVLGSLVGTVYTFGFIMQCPQLYLNYKLKSVAHLPWRMLSYKFFNTIIDDLFAFIIKMPTMHRISCFRDDIVFLIYLYQRWIYRVDYTRVNEFGYKPKQEGDDKISAEAKYWIESIAAQHKIPHEDLSEAFKDGKLLSAMVNSVEPAKGFNLGGLTAEAEQLLSDSLVSLEKASGVASEFPASEIIKGSAPLMKFIDDTFNGIKKKRPDWMAAATEAAAKSDPPRVQTQDVRIDEQESKEPSLGNVESLTNKWISDISSADDVPHDCEDRFTDGRLLCTLANSVKAGSFDVHDLGADRLGAISEAFKILQRSSGVAPGFTSLEVSQGTARVDQYLKDTYVGIKTKRPRWRPSDMLELPSNPATPVVESNKHSELKKRKKSQRQKSRRSRN